MPEAEAKLTLKEKLQFTQDTLGADVRKEAIEAKLAPLDIGAMIFRQVIEQEVPLAIPVVYRTARKIHSLWVRRYLGKKSTGEAMIFADSLGQMLNLAIGLVSLDGEPPGGAEADIFPFVNEADYKSFKTALELRLHFLSQLSEEFVDDLVVNQAWFTQRVRLQLATAGDALGNS